MKKLVVLISGRGSNLDALLARCTQDAWPARVCAVLSNRPEAAGLETARRAGIPAEALPHAGFASREAFDAELARRVAAHAPDWVVLAGFMRVLTPVFLDAFAGRVVNIHPSLLPAFTGLHTHRRALAEGVRVHGATVHLVTPELDHGPILAQAAVPVLDDDDEARLAARVLAAEHRLLPRVMRWLVEDRLAVDGEGRVNLAGVSAADRLLMETE